MSTDSSKIKIMIDNLIGFYLISTVTTFSYWLIIFWNDSSTPKNHLISWQILITASLLWPISVPMSILEKIAKQKQQEISYIQNIQQQESKPLLGQILQQAGLISQTQIGVALKIQQNAEDGVKIGQIIVNKGWLKQETIDFFAEDLLKSNYSLEKRPIGYYLKKSKLLNDEQIISILSEQKEVNLRFGEIAAKKKWLNIETVEYILKYLNNNQLVTTTA